jgi:hypothetical protein
VQVATVVLEFGECVLLFLREKKWVIPNYGAPTWSKLSTQIHSCIHAYVRMYVHKLGISISVRYSKFFVVNFPSCHNSGCNFDENLVEYPTNRSSRRIISTLLHEVLGPRPVTVSYEY